MHSVICGYRICGFGGESNLFKLMHASGTNCIMYTVHDCGSHTLPTQLKYGNVAMKRYLMWTWYNTRANYENPKKFGGLML